MPRRTITLVLDILMVLLGVALAAAVNFMTEAADQPPWVLRIMRNWSPLIVLLVVTGIVALRLWAFWAEKPIPLVRSWRRDRSPFPGLESFTESDAGVFFGRDREIGELYDRLHPSATGRASRFVGVIGPSGVGKSSLVHAGLVPRLTSRRHPWLVLPTMRPGERPLTELARALSVPDLSTAAARASVEAMRPPNGRSPHAVLLVIDQAEELFTLNGAEERQRVLTTLRAILSEVPRLWVIATFRSEFLTGFLSSPFGDMINHPVTVGVLPRTALIEVIEHPAAASGVRLEPPGLAHRMADDTGSGAALPLLAYTLQTLYLNSAGVITEADYARFGGVAGALAQQADRVAGELRRIDPASPVIPTLLKFVAITDGEPTRRRVIATGLTEAERVVADAFVEARLLSADAGVITVAHEALFQHWQPLSEAIEHQHEALRSRAALERWADDWENAQHDPAYLLRDSRLREAREWAEEHPELISDLPAVEELLDVSADIDTEESIHLADSIAQRSLAVARTSPEDALRFAIAAARECAVTPLVLRALSTALTAPELQRRHEAHAAAVKACCWSVDGRHLATLGADRRLRFWDGRTGEALTGVDVPEAASVDLSPDGTVAAVAGVDGSASLYSVPDGERIAVIRAHAAPLREVAFSPDGRMLATASADQTVKVWEMTNRTCVNRLRGHEELVRDVAWSPTGDRLVTASRDRTCRIWDAVSGACVIVLRGHTDWVRTARFSPDGDRLASSSNDRTTRIWDAETGACQQTLRIRSDLLEGVVWSADGRCVATAGDRTVWVHSAVTGAELVSLDGHVDMVTDLAWAPDDRAVATVDGAGALRLWTPPSRAGKHGMVLHGHHGRVRRVRWVDNSHLASVSQDCTARIWRVDSGVERLRLMGHQDWLRSAETSPDGARLATAAADRTARVWDLDDGSELVRLVGHQGRVQTVVWLDETLITGSADGTVRFWELSLGREDEAKRVELAWWTSDLAVSHSRRLLAAAGRGGVSLWPVDDPATRILLPGADGVNAIAFSPDGHRLAAALDDGAVVWWATDGLDPTQAGRDDTAIEPHRLTGHDDRVRDVTWSPDGRYVASASTDRTARLWDTGTGAELCVIGRHPEPLDTVAWSPDGAWVATGGRDGSVRLWRAGSDVARMLDAATSRVFSPLDDAERRSLLLS